MEEEQIKEILNELLKPITKTIYGWGSDVHGHLGTDGIGLLPWRNLKEDSRLSEEIYDKYFAEFEKSSGVENNNFFSDYRYFDIDLYNSFENIKDIEKELNGEVVPENTYQEENTSIQKVAPQIIEVENPEYRLKADVLDKLLSKSKVILES